MSRWILVKMNSVKLARYPELRLFTTLFSPQLYLLEESQMQQQRKQVLWMARHIVVPWTSLQQQVHFGAAMWKKWWVMALPLQLIQWQELTCWQIKMTLVSWVVPELKTVLVSGFHWLIHCPLPVKSQYCICMFSTAQSPSRKLLFYTQKKTGITICTAVPLGKSKNS